MSLKTGLTKELNLEYYLRTSPTNYLKQQLFVLFVTDIFNLNEYFIQINYLKMYQQPESNPIYMGKRRTQYLSKPNKKYVIEIINSF